DGVLLAQGTSQLRTIAEGLVATFSLSHPVQVTELAGLPIEADRISGEIVVGFPSEPIVLVSRSPEKLLAALEVYRTGRDSLRQGTHTLTNLLPRRAGYYLYAASVVPSEHMAHGDNSPQARIFQMAEAATFSIGESA